MSSEAAEIAYCADSVPYQLLQKPTHCMALMYAAELELSPKGQMDKSMGGNMKTSASGNSLSSNQSGSQQEKNQRLKVMAPTALGKSLFGPDEPAIWKQASGHTCRQGGMGSEENDACLH